MKRALVLAVVVLCFQQAAICLATPLARADNPMTVLLDARQAPQGIMQSHMTIPVSSGPFTIVYPKWIPGEHGPTGPLSNMSQLRISANGHDLAWDRDKVDMYTFHVDVPAGVKSIDVDFTVLTNGDGGTMTTRNIAIVNWNRDLLYQQDVDSHDYYVNAAVILPHDWGYATALPGARQNGDRIDFATAPLNMVVDSPLDMGRYYKHILLWQSGSASHWLDVFSDRAADLDFPPQEVAAYKRMMPQALALYGSRHWNEYHSLLTLSDAIGFEGIEHHQSSDDRASEDFMTNNLQQIAGGDLITHEFSHSWNGKYRRPADLTTINYQQPQLTDLLWVYEGMNQYLGDMLSFRTHIREPKSYPEYLAAIYSEMDTEPGRATTPIIDTTTSAPYLYEASGQYPSLRRTSNDFYTEGHLIWLAADVKIRELTGGRKSLDDFEHLFTLPELTGPITKTYTRADVEALLDRVAPYDWHGFFERYVYQVSTHPPYEDIETAGWRLVYTDKPNQFTEAESAGRHRSDYWNSLGLRLGGDGMVRDVRQGSAAWNAHIAAESKVIAIDGQQFDADVLDGAIRQAQHQRAPIQILTFQNGWYTTNAVNYHGGLRYPHLVRIPGRPDMLAKIMAMH